MALGKIKAFQNGPRAEGRRGYVELGTELGYGGAGSGPGL